MKKRDLMDTIDHMPARYIGDGVYALFTGLSIELRANDAHHPTDVIVLEAEVLKALKDFLTDCIDESEVRLG